MFLQWGDENTEIEKFAQGWKVNKGQASIHIHIL